MFNLLVLTVLIGHEPLKLEPPSPDINGIYYCLTDEKEYSATIHKYKNAYIFQWSTGASGFGIRMGDRISVNWHEVITDKFGKEIVARGVTHYRIREQKGKVILTGSYVLSNGEADMDEMILIKRFVFK